MLKLAMILCGNDRAALIKSNPKLTSLIVDLKLTDRGGRVKNAGA